MVYFSLALGLTVLLLAYTYDGLNIVTKYFDYGISLQSNAFELPSSMEETIIQDLTFSPRVFPDYRDRTQIGIENATLFMLVRNYELQEALESMRQIEDRFNKRYRYPWTFLNDDDFTDEFKAKTTGMASGKIEFGKVPEEMWSIPDFIDVDLMKRNMQKLEEENVVYGGVLSYRHMCRFNSGFFFRHPLMNQYEWYWRVEPGVKYYCDQKYDPFTFLRINNKVYGFVIAIYEYVATIPTIWNTTKEFIDKNSEFIASDNALAFITDKTRLRRFDLTLETGSDYNLCHFWSNFEIANLNFYRSQGYLEFFNHLDNSGGFFYERWGDAVVHTLALSLMLNKSQIHHFSDIGYMHAPYHRCPHDDDSYYSGRCVCNENRADDVDFAAHSCLPKWWYHVAKHYMFTDKYSM